jgi:hypothetical protein
LKKTITLLLSIIIGLCVISVALALETDKDKGTTKQKQKIKGNENKGKYLYRKECRPCHKRNSEIGAPELSPNSKTKAQWKEQFIKENYVELECAKEWKKRSEEELNDILTFLYKHAKDSNNPASCSQQ